MADQRTVLKAAAADLAVVVLFVVMGRASHREGGSYLGETAKVLAPFLLALVVAWVVMRAWKQPLAPFPTGIPLWLITAAGGMLLRDLVFDRSTAMGFVIVGSISLLALPGWRLLAEWVRERRGPTTTA